MYHSIKVFSMASERDTKQMRDFSLVETTLVPGRTHNVFALPIKLNLVLRVLETFILTGFNPRHSATLIGGPQHCKRAQFCTAANLPARIFPK